MTNPKKNGVVEKKPQNISLWYDTDNNKNYLLNNETGEMTKVYKTGEWIKEFDASLTGAVGYKQRIERAQNNPAYMPFEARALKYKEKLALYTPQNNKFEGYVQMPHPRTQPYFNREYEFKLNRKKKLFIKDQEDNLSLNNPKNTSTFQYSGLKRYNSGVSFLSGTMNTLNKSQKNQAIEIFSDRKIKPEFQQLDSIQPLSTKSQYKPVSIINNRPLNPPTLDSLKKTLQRTQSVATISNRIHEDINLDEQQKKDRINHQRYTKKVMSVSQKTLSYRTLPKEQTDLMSQYYTQERKRERRLDDISFKFNGLASTTFDKSIKLNLPKSDLTPMVQTTQDLQNILTRKNKELQGFKIPVQKEKETVITQGRFQNVITSQDTQFHKDRDLIMKNFAEETVEKINQKKVQQEEMRRDLLRQVIKEQLINSEKHDKDKCKKKWRETNPHEIY